MIPNNFEYFAPTTIDEALSLLAQHGDDCKILSGGHSLIPVLKLRLAGPAAVVDIGHARGDCRVSRDQTTLPAARRDGCADR
jgi:aerobic carbon-monoxide dehydrogenase medium subunit